MLPQVANFIIFSSIILLGFSAKTLINYAREKENDNKDLRNNYELTNFYLKISFLLVLIIGILLIMFATSVWILP